MLRVMDEIRREGARHMLAAALEAEGDAYLAAFAHERDEDGRRLPHPQLLTIARNEAAA